MQCSWRAGVAEPAHQRADGHNPDSAGRPVVAADPVSGCHAPHMRVRMCMQSISVGGGDGMCVGGLRDTMQGAEGHWVARKQGRGCVRG